MRPTICRAIACGGLAFLVLVPSFAWAGSAAEAAARIDELYTRRDEPEVLKQADAVIAEALKEFPEDYGLLWRASRQKYWLADDEPNEMKKRQLGKAGWDLGDRAVKANPKGAEGHYFAAIGLGAYSEAVGILKALTSGLESKYNERLDAATALDDTLERGGPHLAKGRYWHQLPWPKRDLGKAKDEFNKAIAKFPENLRSYVYLAETLLKDGDAKQAKVVIDKALQGSVDYDPPDGRRAQKWAKPLAKTIEEELK